MKRKHYGRCVSAEITAAVSALELWQAWANPEKIAQWFVDRAEGTCRAGEVMTWIFDAFAYRIPVPILEAEPGKTLVTGDQGPSEPGSIPRLMEVEIETVDGGSKLRLVNSGFSDDDDEQVEGVRSGWAMALAVLKHWLEGFSSRRRTHLFSMRPVTGPGADPARHAALFNGAAGLGRWLDDVRAPGRLAVGDRVSATIGGLPLSGRVLAAPGCEVLLEWSEVGGVIGLKSFAMGKQRAIALDVNVWNGSVEQPALDRALDRLAGVIAGS